MGTGSGFGSRERMLRGEEMEGIRRLSPIHPFLRSSQLKAKSDDTLYASVMHDTSPKLLQPQQPLAKKKSAFRGLWVFHILEIS